jgi:hypothetical protein
MNASVSRCASGALPFCRPVLAVENPREAREGLAYWPMVSDWADASGFARLLSIWPYLTVATSAGKSRAGRS